jgi:hypothetical protein
MATVETPSRPRNLAEAHRRVRSPLERLRGYIRTYVSLEGAVVLGVYLALWFWIGLLLDYGLFRLTSISWVNSYLGITSVDWVQVLPWGARAGLLVVLVAGLLAAVTLKVFTRLFREFRDGALALVLERRFPHILGDRLITAVELADPQQAAALGYSPAMVRQTIDEAAERVEQLPLKEVFHWKRLINNGILVAIMTVGFYLLAIAGFTAVNAIWYPGTAAAGPSDFNEVSGIWFERNVLLRNTIWPRRAHLELVGFPSSGEIRMGRGGKPPVLRVRALKYVVAGAPTSHAVDAYRAWLTTRGMSGDDLEASVREFRKKPAEGWRAVTWFDLTPHLLGGPVPEVELPTEWEPRDVLAGLTLDEIELRLDRAETHDTLAPEVQEAMRNVLEQLERRTSEPGMKRTLRKLEVPDQALLVYKGRTTSNQSTLQRVANNEYTGQFGELKETVQFTVQGLDYVTATRSIVVVDPPALETMTREEERPAYLYYRVGPGVRPEDLTGQKQLFGEANVSLQGGEISRIDVPIGTNITLTAHASKDLQKVWIDPHKAGTEIRASAPEMIDARSFRTRFENVRQEQNFLFKFVDSDGVQGQRQVILIPAEDAAPKVRELSPDDVIRKVQGGYMVAVAARIPFKGKVDDDHGLSAVRYAVSLNRVEVPKLNFRALTNVGSVPLLVPLGQGPLPGLTYLAAIADGGQKDPSKQQKAEKISDQYPLPRFEQALRDREQEFLPLATIRSLLGQKQKEPYRALLRNFEIKPDEWANAETDPLGSDFPLWKLNLKVTDPRLTQPRYTMQLWLEAVDTDLDGERTPDGKPKPHLRASEEKFTFIVVSENELLTEIAKEEERLFLELETNFNRMLESEAKLVQVNVELSNDRVKAEDLGPMVARCDQLNEALDKSQVAVREVATAYARILRELKTNRVDEKMIAKVDTTLVRPLAEVDGIFDKTRDSILEFRKALDNGSAELPARVLTARLAGGVAKEQMRELISKLQAIMAAMEGMTNINKLVKMLNEIDKTETDQYERIKKIQEDYEKQIFEGATKPDKKPEKKEGDR